MTDREKIIAEIERLMNWKLKAIPSGMCQRDVLNIRKGVLLTLKDFINSLPAEQPNFKVEFDGKEYKVVRVRELSNGTTMYGILDEPNHIDYINKDNCRLVKPSEEFEGLEDSIIEYLGHVPENEPEHSETLYTYEQMQEIARHFAQWQKEKTINKAWLWLQHNAEKYVASYGLPSYQTGLLLNDFKHAMED